MRPVVFGHFSEANPETHKLAKTVANLIAERTFSSRGAKSAQETYGVVSYQVECAWVMAAARGHVAAILTQVSRAFPPPRRPGHWSQTGLARQNFDRDFVLFRWGVASRLCFV